MSSPSLRLVASNPGVRSRKPAMRHHLSVPTEARAAQKHGSITGLGVAALAAPLLWIAHALLHALKLV